MEVLKRSIIILCIMGLAGCATASFTKNTYDTLATAAETYRAAMGSASDLYSKGLINDEQKEKIIEYGEDFWLAWHAARDALEAYQDTQDKAGVYQSLAMVSKALGSVLEYVQGLQEGR